MSSYNELRIAIWALVAVMSVMLVTQAMPAMAQYTTEDSGACVPKSGEATKLATISTSKNSGQLAANTTHGFVCTGATAVYWEIGDAAAATADSSSNFLPVDTMLFFRTGNGASSRFISAIDTASAAGDCYIFECE